MLVVREYVDEHGRRPFAKWFDDLDARAAAKVAVSLSRIEMGNLSSVKRIGSGVLECRIDWGPAYRVYLGRDGETLVILLAGGTKKRQQGDIKAAQERWADYQRRRSQEG